MASVFRFIISSGSKRRVGVDGIATDYGLDGSGIESWWGRYFLHLSRCPGAHPSSCTVGTGSFPGGKERLGRDTDPTPPSSAVVMKVYGALYLYLYLCLLHKIIRDAPFPEPSFICFSKVPVNEPPPGSPEGAPMERVAHLQSLFFHGSQFPHKIPLIKEIFPFSQRPWERSVPPCSHVSLYTPTKIYRGDVGRAVLNLSTGWT